MYQVAFEMYPLETRVQMKFLVRGDPPHPHAFAMYLRMQGGEVRFCTQIPAVSYRYEGTNVLPYERSGSVLPNAFKMYQVAFEMYPRELGRK